MNNPIMVQCAWCGHVLTPVEQVKPGSDISHGLCSSCANTQIEQALGSREAAGLGRFTAERTGMSLQDVSLRILAKASPAPLPNSSERPSTPSP